MNSEIGCVLEVRSVNLEHGQDLAYPAARSAAGFFAENEEILMFLRGSSHRPVDEILVPSLSAPPNPLGAASGSISHAQFVCIRAVVLRPRSQEDPGLAWLNYPGMKSKAGSPELQGNM
jgi:hypothetical protein